MVFIAIPNGVSLEGANGPNWVNGGLGLRGGEWTSYLRRDEEKGCRSRGELSNTKITMRDASCLYQGITSTAARSRIWTTRSPVAALRRGVPVLGSIAYWT